jgi:uncharacterized repeat protein (TIGR01451 family)
MDWKFSRLRGIALTLWSLTWVAMAAGQANPYPYFEVAPIAFAPRVEYAAGVGPFSLTTLDWNGDGQLDLIVPNRDSGDLTIFLGAEDGTFVRQMVPLRGGNCPIQVKVADLNRDQKDDLVVINHLCHSVFVFLGNGDGTIAERIGLPVEPEPRSIAIGLFDEDDTPDLAIVHRRSGTLSLYFGRGDGSFTPPRDYPVGVHANAVASGDFDGDGRADLSVVSSGMSRLTLFRNLGGGQFLRQSDLPVGVGITTLQVVDLNRDGNVDLVVLDAALDQLHLLLGRGDFLFDSPRSYSVGRRPFELESADLNRDGIPDLIVTHQEENDLWVLLGRGDGTLARTTHLNRLPTGRVPFGVVAADFNRDGRVDLATADFGSNTISILLAEEPRFADLLLTQVVNRETVQARDELLYRLTVTNQGPDPAIELLVTDLLPEKTLMVSCTASGGGVCGIAGNARVVLIPTLAVGGQVEIEFLVRVQAEVCEGDVLVNTATVSARTADPNLEDNQTVHRAVGQNPLPVIQSLPNLLALGSRPGDRTGARVEFPLPVATDNTPVVRVTCSHPSGAIFPVGTTRVTCTAVDVCGATATTSFEIEVWDAIAIDEKFGHLFLFDSFTGQYLFVRQDTGERFRGRGQIRRWRCEIQLLDDRRATLSINTCYFRASGWVRPTGNAPIFTILDRNIRLSQIPQIP